MSSWVSKGTYYQTYSEKIFSSLDHQTLGWALQQSLQVFQVPEEMFRVFGSSLVQGENFSLILSALFHKSISSTKKTQVLAGYLSLADKTKVPVVLEKALTLWGDETEVNDSRLERLYSLSWLMLILLCESKAQPQSSVENIVTRYIVRGVGVWLEAGREKRELGMVTATAMLKRAGGSVPDWEIQDTRLLQEFEQLATYKINEAIDIQDASEILINWNVKVLKDISTPSITIVKSSLKSDNPTVTDLIKSEDPLDSDDDEPDDLPAYDMSSDTVVTEESKVPILYLRDIISHLSEAETVQTERCLKLLPSLSARHLSQEDPQLVPELVKLVLYSENKFDSSDFHHLKQEAVKGMILAQPIACCTALVPAVFEKENPLNTKMLVLDSLESGAASLSSEQHPGLSSYLSLCVRGLCRGQGGPWASLSLRGLDTALLSHTITTTAGLLKHSLNQPAYLSLATLFTSFLLSVAGHKGTQVKASILHSLLLVSSLTPGHLLTSASPLLSLLRQGAAWAASGISGPVLAEQAGHLVTMVELRQQQAVQQEIQRDLSQDMTIKMKVDKPSIVMPS